MKELSQLVQAAQAGDTEAYAALVSQFQEMAYATAYRYVGDHYLAQDVVQEAIIESLLHLHQLREPSAFPGWFRQIVFRQCTRVLRQTTLPCSSLEAVSGDLFAESNPEDSVMRAEIQANVRLALATLPRHEQLVTALFYGCRYSYREICTLLNIPITTVKKRLHSARQKLKVQLQALHNEIENVEVGAEEIEVILAIWWNWLTQNVKARKDFKQYNMSSG